jgi:hypothetical protein
MSSDEKNKTIIGIQLQNHTNYLNIKMYSYPDVPAISYIEYQPP